MSKRRNQRKIKKVLVKVCPACKESFKTTVSFQKYCSVECRRSVEPFYANRELWTKTCEVCHILFETYRTTQKYCSLACRQKHNREIYDNDKELLRELKERNTRT